MTPNLPSFHDGHFEGIMLGDDSATLSLARSDGTPFEVKMVGLDALQINDFRQGNIIFSLEVVSGRQPEREGLAETMDRLFPALHPKAASSFHIAHAALLAAKLAAVASGQAALVSITSSYGADLVALCKTVECQQRVSSS